MKDAILARINQLNIELNTSTGTRQIECLENIIILECELLNILKMELIK